jgi:hypothetical protein
MRDKPMLTGSISEKRCRYCGSKVHPTKAHRKTKHVKGRDPADTYWVCNEHRDEANKIMGSAVHEVKETGQPLYRSSCIIGTVPTTYSAGSYNRKITNIPEEVHGELLEQDSRPKKGDYDYYFTMVRSL